MESLEPQCFFGEGPSPFTLYGILIAFFPLLVLIAPIIEGLITGVSIQLKVWALARRVTPSHPGRGAV